MAFPRFKIDEMDMTKNIIDLHQYKKSKADYQKLMEKNPYMYLSFEDYFKVREFLEEVHKARLKKRLEEKGD